ncbi:Uncharacterised protein [Actinomyces howellii]|uniref:Uncharacterized protein n=1 Tax=Actinomyces howellii TaxID=52771 RepID=A0A3S4SNJ9_9ACTO|nr:Uncharacterised protein [Actinomyces howellii]
MVRRGRDRGGGLVGGGCCLRGTPWGSRLRGWGSVSAGSATSGPGQAGPGWAGPTSQARTARTWPRQVQDTWGCALTRCRGWCTHKLSSRPGWVPVIEPKNDRLVPGGGPPRVRRRDRCTSQMPTTASTTRTSREDRRHSNDSRHGPLTATRLLCASHRRRGVGLPLREPVADQHARGSWTATQGVVAAGPGSYSAPSRSGRPTPGVLRQGPRLTAPGAAANGVPDAAISRCHFPRSRGARWFQGVSAMGGAWERGWLWCVGCGLVWFAMVCGS